MAWIYPFFVLALTGFATVFGIHIASLLGVVHPFDHSIKVLFPILFVLWLLTIFVMNRLCRNFKQKDVWRAALRGCPTWWRRAVWVLFGYSWIGFFVLPAIYGGGMSTGANGARVGSAVLMTFYFMAASVLYSATRVEKSDGSRHCLNGHHVSPLAKYCKECGAPVQDNSQFAG
jgi:hypothetical protein